MLCFLQHYHKINVALSATAFALTSLSTIEGFFVVDVAQCSALVVFYKAASAGGGEGGGKKPYYVSHIQV